MNGEDAGSAVGGTVSGYRNLTRLLLRSDGLLGRAATALRRTVAADPENADALLRLGDTCRGLGKLREALGCYERVASLRPGDRKAPWLAAILSGSALPPAAPEVARPMPFVRKAGFLPPQRCSALLALALASRERFAPAKVIIEQGPKKTDSAHGRRGSGDAGQAEAVEHTVDPSRRKARIVDHRIIEREVRPWFEALLRDAFSRALPRLGMREPSRCWVELAMTAYLPGGFFAKHLDDGRYPTRMVSFVYYFHRQPKRFSGGELLLYDGDGTGAFTLIEPRHNSIVFYPASGIHKVATVHGDSADFDNARFAIHGWLHRQRAAG